MSDTEVVEKKRGRPAKNDKESDAREIKEAKKRVASPKPDAKDEKSNENGVPAKRGRGRPKGTAKKSSSAAAKKPTGRGRGRPKGGAKKKKATTESEEDEEENGSESD